MSLFKNQIKTLIATMSKVKEVEAFNMQDWYEKDDALDCGFAACICGSQAATKKSEFFSNDNNDNFNYQAGNIAENLELSCSGLTGDGFLARSIYDADCGDRHDNACNSDEFTEEELDHPHLTKKNPTPADAISFMELVLTKLDDIK